MAKMTKFSSWNADAVLGRYMVDGNKEFLLDMVKDLEAEYARWEKTNRLPSSMDGQCHRPRGTYLRHRRDGLHQQRQYAAQTAGF